MADQTDKTQTPRKADVKGKISPDQIRTDRVSDVRSARDVPYANRQMTPGRDGVVKTR